MKRIHARLMVVSAAHAVAFTGTAFAGGVDELGGAVPAMVAPPPHTNMPVGARPAQMPPIVATTPGTSVLAAGTDPGKVFSSLDRGNKGFLNSTDVVSHRFLAGHFQACDRNHDGRLSESEVQACLPRDAGNEK